MYSDRLVRSHFFISSIRGCLLLYVGNCDLLLEVRDLFRVSARIMESWWNKIKRGFLANISRSQPHKVTYQVLSKCICIYVSCIIVFILHWYNMRNTMSICLHRMCMHVSLAGVFYRLRPYTFAYQVFQYMFRNKQNIKCCVP